MKNDKFIQLTGPFANGEEIIEKIKKEYASDFKYIKKIGIQTSPKHFVKLNNNYIFEIGKSNILEMDNIIITALSFLQNELDSTILDIVLG